GHVALLDLDSFPTRRSSDLALDNLASQYSLGADPAVVIQDLLELTHWLTRVKVIGGSPDDVALPETQRLRGKELAAKLGMPVLRSEEHTSELQSRENLVCRL